MLRKNLHFIIDAAENARIISNPINKTINIDAFYFLNFDSLQCSSCRKKAFYQEKKKEGSTKLINNRPRRISEKQSFFNLESFFFSTCKLL